MPYNPKGEWEDPHTINPNSLTKDTSTIISKPINKQKVIPYNSDVCDKNQLNKALSYDREVFDLYTLLSKKNSSRTWYNNFRLDESGLNKRLNLFYSILSFRFVNFGKSVDSIKYKLKSVQFNEYCYFQALKNIYINIKRKYLTNPFTSTIEPTMNDAILKVYLFFLVQYFNDYISRYKDMLVKRGNHQKKAININNKNILLNTYNKSYSSIINNSIRETNNNRFMIQENYEPYKLCIIFYERFYKVYNSLLIFSPKFIFNQEVQILIERIDKLNYLLVKTVTGRIERNKQRKLELQRSIEEQRAEEKARKAREASLPPSKPSWTSEHNPRDLAKMNISLHELKQRQINFEISRARNLQEKSNNETIQACSTLGASMYQSNCNQARARQAKRNLNRKEKSEMYRLQYYQTHGIYPPDGAYIH